MRLGFKLCSLMAVGWLGVGVAQIDIPTEIVSFLMCQVCGAISISHSKSTFQNRFFFYYKKRKILLQNWVKIVKSYFSNVTVCMVSV